MTRPTPPAVAHDEVAARRLLVRRPVLDGRLEVVAHELLRPGPADGDRRARQAMLADLAMADCEDLSDGLPVYASVSWELLAARHLEELAARSLWLAVEPDLQGRPPDVDALRTLRREGHRVVFRGLTADDPRWDLLGECDIVATDADSPLRHVVVAAADGEATDVLVTGVDTPELADDVLQRGADYLQGSFVMRPRLVTAKPRTVPVRRVEMLEVVSKREIDLDRLAGLIRQDLPLADRFLRYINSAAFGLRTRVDSIRHALALIGDERARRWVSLMALTATEGSPEVVNKAASMRADLCESIGRIAGMPDRGLSLFMVGMFSLLDVVLDIPLEQAIDGLPLAEDARAALVRREGPLAPVLEAAVGLQASDWEQAAAALERLGLTEQDIAAPYLEAVTASW